MENLATFLTNIIYWKWILLVNEFNEISYAKYIIENGFLTNRKLYEINILSKYYYYLKQSSEEVEKNIILFCEKNITNFSYARYIDKITKIVKNSKKTPISEVSKIDIYKEEINFILSFNEDRYFNQVLLSLFMMKKIRLFLNQKSYLNYKYSKFSKYCGLRETKDIYKIIKKLEDYNLVRVCRNSNLEILFDVCSSGDVAFSIKDFYSPYKYLKNYLGEKRYFECEHCGKMVQLKSNRQKYCKECSRIVNILKTMERKRV